ncbi:hypothetical protein I4U23_018743 [Adineta vaga]|nr:hypothetical protein I4U23_018743 [Adineta vaga]
MLAKCQIVPALASAVHGVIEEIPHLPESPSPQLNRSRLASSTSSTASPTLINTDVRSMNNFTSQMASNAVTTSLSSNQSRTTSQLDARKAFAYFDKNGDGKLSIKEFKSVMHDLGYKTVDKRFIKQIFAEADRNGNGRSLGFDEFVEFLESKLSIQTNSTHPITTTMTRPSLPLENNSSFLPKMQLDVETLFNCYDLDKNGYIEPKELRKVMKRLTGEKLSKQDIEEMISIADKNGDGLLDKSEFALLCSAF